MSFIVIDDNLRTMTIPEDIVLLGVESDDDVNKIPFRMPKTYSGFDLSTFEIRINYMNAKGEGDIYVVDDMTVVDDDLTFSWLVGRNACKYKGQTKFIVCLKKFDQNSNVIQEFNTTVYTLPVLEGLETVGAVEQQYPDIIEYILQKLEPSINIFNASNVIPYGDSVIYHSETIDVSKTGYKYEIDGTQTSSTMLELFLFDSGDTELHPNNWQGKTAIISGIYPDPSSNENYYFRQYVNDNYTESLINSETNEVFVDIDVTRIAIVLKLGENLTAIIKSFYPYINFNYANSQQQLTRDVQDLKENLIMDVSNVGF